MANEHIAFIAGLLGVIFLQNLLLLQSILALLLVHLYKSKRKKIVKVYRFFEMTTPFMDARIYRRYYRMNRETIDVLVTHLRRVPELHQDPRYRRIPLQKKISMTCAYLGCSLPTLQLAHLFGISEESFLRITEDVIDAFISLIDQFIVWPNENELAMYALQYESVGRFFPNCIGSLDDVHLEIKLTEEQRHRRSYFCWKQYYSIHLQAVATYDLRFLDVFVGWPGKSHDSRVFHNNPLYRNLPSRLRHQNAGRLIDTYHIIADSAFPLSPQVMTPFKKPRQRDLNDVERKFNRHLSSKRNNVERSFALLLQRFPRLLKLNQRTLSKKIKVVMASCILHNICILENDNIDYYLERAQRNRYRALNQRYRPLGTLVSSDLGKLKRLQMANLIYQF